MHGLLVLLRRLSWPYIVLLTAVNLYFYNYARIASLGHPAADIRFNIYGDPQIEGDAKLKRQPRFGRYDLFANDIYIHHVYKSTIEAFNPHYAVTMGDIFSSQWVNTREYYKRIHRFKWISHQIDSNNSTIQGNHIYYFLAGNHDIGYGEETKKYHITRYLNNFGQLNHKWYFDFERVSNVHTDMPGIHKVAILNAMNLDATRNDEYRRQVWGFVRDLATERAKHSEIPFILFLHIPLNKPAGVCEPSPVTKLKDGFIAYQDYLSPATSAFLLHCLRPTIILNGHDHNGCLATHFVINTTHSQIHLGDSGRSLQSSDDLCTMTLEELDMHRSEIEVFAESTVSTSGSSNITTADHLWSTIEITARSTMGAYGGVTGIFDIRRDHALDRDKTFHLRDKREMSASAKGYQYQYREVALGHHIAIRVLLITDIVSAVIVPALLLLVK